MKARTVDETSADKFGKLRISQAYIKLLSIPENASGPRMVSLLSLANYEVRMFEPSEASADTYLFWLELFDHDGGVSLDSCNCSDMENALTAFEHLVAQAIRAHEASLRGERDQ